MKRNIVLAFETGVGGGSISLFMEGKEIDFWKGEANLSRAEDLLIQIAELLRRNNIRPKEIRIIFFSNGPGSFTGLRIGKATAKGLQKSLNCRCYGINILEAMLLKLTAEGIIAVAVSSGTEQVWRQIFRMENSNEVNVLSSSDSIRLENLITDISTLNVSILLSQSDLFDKVRQMIPDFNAGMLNYIKIDEALSRFIGLKGIQIFGDKEIFPIHNRYEREN